MKAALTQQILKYPKRREQKTKPRKTADSTAAQWDTISSYAPHAPADMIAGLGKKGQIVSVSPSRGLVVVRMGNPPQSAGTEIPSQLCDQIWQKLKLTAEAFRKVFTFFGPPLKISLFTTKE